MEGKVKQTGDLMAVRVVRLTALGFAGMGLVNGGRALQAWQNTTLLAPWRPALSYQVAAAVSICWTAVFLVGAWGTLRRLPWGRRLALWLAPVYGLYSVAVTLLFSVSAYARGRWVVQAVGWAAAGLAIGWLLTHSRARALFVQKDKDG